MLAYFARMIWGATTETPAPAVKEEQPLAQSAASVAAPVVTNLAPSIEMSELEQYQTKLHTLRISFEEESNKRRKASLVVTSVEELKQTGEEKVPASDLGKNSVWVMLTNNFNANLEADYHALLDSLLGEYEKLIELKNRLNTDQDYIQLCERSAILCLTLKEFINKIKTKIESEQHKEEVVHQDLELVSFKLLEMIIQEGMQSRLALVARFLSGLMPKQVSVAQTTEQNLPVQIEPALDKINTFLRKMVESLGVFNELTKAANNVKATNSVSKIAKRIPSLSSLTIKVPKAKIESRRTNRNASKLLSKKSLFHPPAHSNPTTPAAAMAVHNTAGDDSPIFPPGMFGPSK